VLIEDCYIPLFLKDKLYADFRTKNDEALEKLIDTTGKILSNTLRRIKSPTFNRDYGLWWGLANDKLDLNLTILDMPTEYPYSVITEITIRCCEKLAKRYETFYKKGFDWFQRQVILKTISDSVEKTGLMVNY
jgi:hypothetical protein